MFVHRQAAVNRPDVTASSRSEPASRPARTVPAGRRFPVNRRLLRELLLLVLVITSATIVLRGPATSQGFTIDESRWISTSRYFWITFVDRDLFGPAWQPNYIVMTHPPVARYIIGFGLWLQGWSPDQLNGRYDSLESRAWNDRAGNVPDLDLLHAARRVTFVFAVASVTLVYAVGRSLGGPTAGIVAVAFALISPLLSTVWTRALAESIVAAFSLLTLFLALRVMPKVGELNGRTLVPLAVGVALALAAATKLNGALGALGLGLYAAVQQGLALLTTWRTSGFRSWVDVGLGAVIVFVAVNPLLYVRPTERAIQLYLHRQDEMEYQRIVFSDQAVPDALSERVARVGRRAFDTYATPSGPLPFSPDVLLVPLGLALLGWRAGLDLRRRTAGRPLLFLCWLGATYAVITVNLGFDSSHYFAPTAMLNVVVIGVAVEGVMRGALRWLGPRLPPLRRGRAQKTQAPAT